MQYTGKLSIIDTGIAGKNKGDPLEGLEDNYLLIDLSLFDVDFDCCFTSGDVLCALNPEFG